ncbi:hypothetical protein KY348_05210 [Candidatus Woesearchaeota archaeon]|nr:hypothetical protein [Candidatus Woesearchaeota archaeon]
MFKKNPEKDLAKELSGLKKRADKQEKELERLERLEKSLAQQEVVLAKKIADMNKFEEDLKELVSKHELEELRKDLKKSEKHEEVLAENARFMTQLVNELGKIKESHRMTRSQVMAKEHVSKKECEDRFVGVKESLEDLERIRKTHRKKAGHNDLKTLRKELHDKLAQVEHQNKVLMRYLKRVDEMLQKK